MRQPNGQRRLQMKAKPPQVEPKGWGDGAIMVTPIDLQGNEKE